MIVRVSRNLVIRGCAIAAGLSGLRKMNTRIKNALVGGVVGFGVGLILLRGMWPLTTLIGGGIGHMIKKEEPPKPAPRPMLKPITKKITYIR